MYYLLKIIAIGGVDLFSIVSMTIHLATLVNIKHILNKLK